jgi:hypothetical protein
MKGTIMLHPVLQERLQKKEEHYKRVTAFAEKLPLFANDIIELTEDGEMFFKLASHYKGVYFAWGINWYVNKPSNFPDERVYEPGVVNVYLNGHSLFGETLSDFAHQELGKVVTGIKCYFYDNLNSTFYFKPDEVEEGLDKIAEWYHNVKSESAVYLKELKRKELQDQLKALED